VVSTDGDSLAHDLTDLGCSATGFTYTLDLGTLSEQAENLVSQLEAGTYTTIVCACDPVFPVYLTGQEEGQGYLPEFVEAGEDNIDSDYVPPLYNQTAVAEAFGISTDTPSVAFTQTPGLRAYKAVDLTGVPAAFVNQIYEQMEQLAIGIQMAGPDLTPANFAAGMQTYPARSGSFGLWDFSSAQQTAPDDFREVCWNPTSVSPVTGREGTYRGTSSARWTAATVPAGQPGCPT
jgi:hypothetical protein